ncbi:MAG: hypothetical protein Q7S27_02690 [Nanoarchaeota archaeon]|nr:hypothetical protein [Nanoarchaeota archaeon]
MAERFVKMFEVNEKGISGTRLVNKEDSENLRGKIVILRPEDSEIAKRLDIKDKGVYGARFR